MQPKTPNSVAGRWSLYTPDDRLGPKIPPRRLLAFRVDRRFRSPEKLKLSSMIIFLRRIPAISTRYATIE